MSNKNKKRKGVKILVWTVIIVVLAGLAGTYALVPKSDSFSEITTTKGDITTYFTFNGSVEAKNKETIFADKAMQIKEIKVEKGQLIEEDQILMTTTMGEKIKAKIVGEISKIYPEKNAQLMPGAKLIDIVDYENLKLNIQVDEYDLSAISENKDAIITIHALNKNINGKILEVSKEGIYQNGVTFFNATVELEKDSELRIGMSAEVKVLDNSVTNVDTLPMSVIEFDSNNKPYVMVRDEKKTKQAYLELGITDGVTVEVKSGVTAQDIIVIQKDDNSQFGPGAMRPGRDLDSMNGGN